MSLEREGRDIARAVAAENERDPTLVHNAHNAMYKAMVEGFTGHHGAPSFQLSHAISQVDQNKKELSSNPLHKELDNAAKALSPKGLREQQEWEAAREKVRKQHEDELLEGDKNKEHEEQQVKEKKKQKKQKQAEKEKAKKQEIQRKKQIKAEQEEQAKADQEREARAEQERQARETAAQREEEARKAKTERERKAKEKAERRAKSRPKKTAKNPSSSQDNTSLGSSHQKDDTSEKQKSSGQFKSQWASSSTVQEHPHEPPGFKAKGTHAKEPSLGASSNDPGLHTILQEMHSKDQGSRKKGPHSDQESRIEGLHSDQQSNKEAAHSDHGSRKEGMHPDHGSRKEGAHSDRGSQERPPPDQTEGPSQTVKAGKGKKKPLNPLAPEFVPQKKPE